MPTKRNPVLKAQSIFDAAVRLQVAGRVADAVALYRQALSFQPGYAEAHSNLGVALAAQDQLNDAVAHYQRAIAIKPDYADAHNNLGAAFVAQGRRDDAVAHYQRAIALNPSYAEANYNLAVALAGQGKIDDAVTHYERALVLRPGYAEAHNNLGVALGAQGRINDARAHYQRALALRPDLADTHANLANLLTWQGELDAALVHYDQAIALNPASAEAHFNRAEIRTFRRGDADLAALEALTAANGMPAAKMTFLHFALGKALEDAGDYQRAFEHLRKGNDLKRREIHYDETGTARLLARTRAAFPPALFDGPNGGGDPSQVPIFVLGMPRSGSTLIEQILAGHPQIQSAGELPELERAARAVLSACDPPVRYPECAGALDGAVLRRIGQAYLARIPALKDGKTRIVDKMPANFLYVGLIRLILPNAKIVHTTRNPIDTCVSCYSKLFTSSQLFSYDLAELGRFYRRYAELMTHWRAVLPAGAMLEVAYEDVVDNLETQARRLIGYCGLPWDDRCLSFHKTDGHVKTASAAQVRQPLFRTSLQRWRRYEAALGPLLGELPDLRDAERENFPCSRD